MSEPFGSEAADDELVYNEFGLDEEQRAELLRLAAEARANPGVGVSWPELKARLLREQ